MAAVLLEAPTLMGCQALFWPVLTEGPMVWALRVLSKEVAELLEGVSRVLDFSVFDSLLDPRICSAKMQRLNLFGACWWDDWFLQVKYQPVAYKLNITMDTSMDDVAAHEIPFSPLLDFDPTPPALASKALESAATANLSPSPRLKSQSLGSSPISKKLSPKGGVKKASMSLKKDFQIARGKSSRSLADTAFSSPLVKDDDLKEDLNVESFSSQLDITPALRLLTISEL
ncbi:hypothetical protein GOP47_0014707 [Adiantum capillus-veneris]|uniref:Uncharacterized protein n=1 Tax=Adiantum capillus-veneris TaxID=13818 RepID=A0A9D4UMJ3_ADICA|nr:hypothetical protein GOP47_0014707 [Adiantum capillus-veneris]